MHLFPHLTAQCICHILHQFHTTTFHITPLPHLHYATFLIPGHYIPHHAIFHITHFAFRSHSTTHRPCLKLQHSTSHHSSLHIHITQHFTSDHNSNQIALPHLCTPFHITPTFHLTPRHAHHHIQIPYYPATLFETTPESFRHTPPCLIWRQTIPHHSVLHNHVSFTSSITAHRHIPEYGLLEWMRFVILRARSRERSQRTFGPIFWVGVVSRCVTVELNLESRSSTNANTIAVAKITVERGWRVEKCLCVVFWPGWPLRRSRVHSGKKCVLGHPIAQATSYCLMPDTLRLRATKNAFKVGSVKLANSLSPPSIVKKVRTGIKSGQGT